MDKKKNIEIHETAFMTSMFRSSDQDLSGDTFAHLWDNDKTRVWVENHTNEVSVWEPTLHCLRNRYILDTINEICDSEELDVVVNFGSGFSMYPFCTSESLHHLEIDKEEVISYKRQCINAWMMEGVLPERSIEFIKADFNQENQTSLKEKLISVCREKKSLFLIEGVFFFLDPNATSALFELFSEVQEEGYVVSVSYVPSIEATQAFQNLQKFFEQRLGMGKEFEYQLIAEEYYINQKKYDLVDHVEAFQLIERYLPGKRAPRENDILNEHIYLLKKKVRDD